MWDRRASFQGKNDSLPHGMRDAGMRWVGYRGSRLVVCCNPRFAHESTGGMRAAAPRRIVAAPPGSEVALESTRQSSRVLFRPPAAPEWVEKGVGASSPPPSADACSGRTTVTGGKGFYGGRGRGAR